jgi:hypothetical protein
MFILLLLRVAAAAQLASTRNPHIYARQSNDSVAAALSVQASLQAAFDKLTAETAAAGNVNTAVKLDADKDHKEAELDRAKKVTAAAQLPAGIVAAVVAPAKRIYLTNLSWANQFNQ